MRSATRASVRSRCSALPAALQFFTQAFELWPDDDPDWAYVALRQGRVEHDVRQAGTELPLVARAFERFLERGDVDRAAEAEVLLAERDWFAGRSDSTFARLERARSLVDGRPTSVSKARTYAELSRFRMLAGRYEDAVDVGGEALALAREVGVRELQAHVLTNIGTARVGAGDLGGYADLEEAFSIAEPINSIEALRAQGNDASLLADYGELHRAREMSERNNALAERLGFRGFMTWGDMELALLDYHAGRWDHACAVVAAFLDEMGDGHYLEPVARLIQGTVMIGRGETERALVESERALAFARDVKDPQVVYPTLAWRARLLAVAGEDAQSGGLVDELIALAAEGEYNATHWSTLAAFALDDLGRSAEAVAMLERLTTPTHWLTAALTYARGDRARAADMLGEMGDHTDEAYARLRAAETGGGIEQASRALEFYRGVGASAFVRRAEALLPASA